MIIQVNMLWSEEGQNLVAVQVICQAFTEGLINPLNWN